MNWFLLEFLVLVIIYKVVSASLPTSNVMLTPEAWQRKMAAEHAREQAPALAQAEAEAQHADRCREVVLARRRERDEERAREWAEGRDVDQASTATTKTTDVVETTNNNVQAAVEAASTKIDTASMWPHPDTFSFLAELDTTSNLRYGLLFIMALSSLTVYSIILAGWASNSKYAFIGALRSAAQMISYEVSITLILLPVILLSGSLNLTQIVFAQAQTVWFILPLLPIGLIFLVAMLAETNRTPFDLPEAEAELVAGYNVDYSSLPFAMFFLGEYSNMILMAVLFCLLFAGGWTFIAFSSPFILVFKAAFVWFFFVLVRASLPRYRYDQLMDIGWKSFLPFASGYLFFVIGLVVLFQAVPVVQEIFASA